MATCTAVPPRTADHETEADQVRRAQAGDEAAIGIIYNRYRIQYRVWFARYLTHKEWVPEFADAAAAALYEALPQFNGELSGFKTWAYRIGYTGVIKYVRKLKTERNDVSLTDMIVATLPALRSPELDYIYTRLHEEVEKLPYEQRVAVKGWFFEGYSDREISEVYGIPRRRVCYRRKQGLAALAERLADVALMLIRPELRFPGYNYDVDSNMTNNRPAQPGREDGDNA
jgi:RNA polymerase sigma-70 factor, ECF subfamily